MRPLAPDEAPAYDKAAALDLCVSYNDRFKDAVPALFRDDEIAQAMATLRQKNKPNPLLVGPAGVGKTKIVEDIARRIEAAGTSSVLACSVPRSLLGAQVWELPLASLVSGSTLVGQLEQKLLNLVACFEDPDNNLILFVDEIHQLMCGTNGYSQIAQVLKPALARGRMRVIGATTSQEADELLSDPALMRRFNRVSVPELTRDQATEVLRRSWPGYRDHYQDHFDWPDDDMDELEGWRRVRTEPELAGCDFADIALIADVYRPAGSHRPDSALTVLDHALADAAMRRCAQESLAMEEAEEAGDLSRCRALGANPRFPVTREDVERSALRLVTGTAPDVASADADDVAANLSGVLCQERAKSQVLGAIQQRQLMAFPDDRPLSLLLCGPSGVGKTETALRVAETLTGQPPVRLDLGSYAEEGSANRIIGSPVGYVGSDSHAELPFDILETNPYQVVLLDELEKAHPSVQKLFLSVLDEGTLTTARGKVVDFRRAVVVATTNAGYPGQEPSPCGFNAGPRERRADATGRLAASGIAPELVQRFDLVVPFDPVDREAYAVIVADHWRREVEALARFNPQLFSAHARVLPAELAGAEAKGLAERTYSPETGARDAVRAVRREITRRILDDRAGAI